MWEMKPKKNKNGLWYISEPKNKSSWYSYLFSRCEIGEFSKYIDYIIKQFNGKLDKKLYFDTEENTIKAIEWIESLLVMRKLVNEN